MEQKNAIPKLMSMYWVEKEVGFIISFHPPFIEFLQQQISKPGRLFQDFIEKNPSFIFSTDEFKNGVGVGSCLKPAVINAEDPGTTSFWYKIPSMKGFLDEDCPDCGGTKFSKINDWDCYACRKTGKHLVDDTVAVNSFHDFGMSVYIFSKLSYHAAMNYIPKTEDSQKKMYSPDIRNNQQTMLFEISEDTGVCVAFMWAWLHEDIIQKVLEFNELEEMKIREAMRAVEVTLYQKKDEDIYGFRFSFNSDGKFWLQVPGSACTLGVESQFNNLWEWGRVLSPHNIDHRTAQISLLAGLTVLNQIAYEKM